MKPKSTKSCPRHGSMCNTARAVALVTPLLLLPIVLESSAAARPSINAACERFSWWRWKSCADRSDVISHGQTSRRRLHDSTSQPDFVSNGRSGLQQRWDRDAVWPDDHRFDIFAANTDGPSPWLFLPGRPDLRGGCSRDAAAPGALLHPSRNSDRFLQRRYPELPGSPHCERT
jgi:hypothetical protein